MSAQAVDKQQAQGKQNPPAQIRNAEDIRQFFKHYCKTSNLPPALVILSCADFENLCACTVMAAVNSPSPKILTGCLVLMTPALRNTSGVIVVSPSSTSRSKLTMLNSLRQMLVKPRFGMRRCSGLCPPSKPRITRRPPPQPSPPRPPAHVIPLRAPPP